MNVAGEIERVERISKSEFEHYVLRDTPLIIGGALESWPALTAWDPRGLTERIGSVSTRFKVSPSHRHPDFAEADFKKVFRSQEGTFAEWIAKLQPRALSREQGESAARHYLLTGEEEYLIRRRPGRPEERNQKLIALFDDMATPPYFDEERLYSSWFWMSGAGVRTWLHYDNNGCHNLNAQVRGKKRVWLISPDQLARTYPFPFDGPLPAYNCCQVDIESASSERHPAFADVQCVTGEVRAGDLLFLPANWIHSFLHTGSFNVNVNFWWKPEWVRQSVVSVRQALIDACTGLGGISSLPADVRDTLTELEQKILSGDAVQSSAGY